MKATPRPTENRRQTIIEAGLAILREDGLAGFTQPGVAARAKLRQSHLTYYFPTRSDLLAAVARAAVDRQLAAAQTMARGITSLERAAAAFAAVVAQHENTRVLVALNQAADKEPEVLVLFNELLEGFVAVLLDLLERLGLSPDTARVDLVHALFVGLSVIELATSRPNGKARARKVLRLAFSLLSSKQGAPGRPRLD